MKFNKYLILMIAGALLMATPYLATLAVSNDPIDYTVYVYDENLNTGVEEAFVFVFRGGGSTMEDPNNADFVEVTDSFGYAYFVLEPDFYRICCSKAGYTSDWSNDVYTYAMATGVSSAISDTLIMNVYSGDPSGPENWLDQFNGLLFIPGVALFGLGLFGYVRRKK